MIDYGGPISGVAVGTSARSLLFAVTADVPGWAAMAAAAVRSMAEARRFEPGPALVAGLRGQMVTSYGPPSNPWTNDVVWLQLRVHRDAVGPDDETDYVGRPASLLEVAEYLDTLQLDPDDGVEARRRYSFSPRGDLAVGEEAPAANPGYVGPVPRSWSPTGVCVSVSREYGTRYRVRGPGGTFCARWPRRREVALLLTDAVPDWERLEAAARGWVAAGGRRFERDVRIDRMWVAGGRAHDRRALTRGAGCP